MIPKHVHKRTSSFSRPRTGLFASIVAIFFAAFLSSTVEGQTARLAGQVIDFGSTLGNSAGVTADSSQNVYVVSIAGVVEEETYNSATLSYTETPLFTTAAGTGSAIAVDSAGKNLYIGTGAADTVEHWMLASGTWTKENTFSGFTGLATPAVDKNGNVYIADEKSGYLYEEVGSVATYTQTILIKTLTSPAYVAVDASATPNIFVASTGGVFAEVSGTTHNATTLTIGVAAPLGLAVDAKDNLYVPSATEVEEATLAGTTYTTGPFYQYVGSAIALDNMGNAYLVAPTLSGGTKLVANPNFGSVGPGPAAQMTVAFTLTSTTPSTTVSSATAETQGFTGYDFSVGSGGTCAGASFIAGNSCTVILDFQPQATGARLGAVDLTAANGNKIVTAFVGGVGLTPLAVYQSATLVSTIACPGGSNPSCVTALNQGRGLTLDPKGDIYVADQDNYRILEFPAGSQTPNVLLPNTESVSVKVNNVQQCSPSATTLDGEGNLYYTCNAGNYIYELTAAQVAADIAKSGADAPTGIYVGYPTDDHLSADAAGNLYTTTYVPSNLFLEIASGTHAVSTVATAPSGSRFVGAVTDANGNTFAPDYINNILYELPAGSSTLTQLYSGGLLVSPHAIGEDAAGDLYVTTTETGSSGAGTSPLLLFTSNNYSAAPSQINVLGSDSVAVAANGDIYTVYNNTFLYRYSRGLFNLAFPGTTPVGQSSAIQTVELENAGTAPLTISPPSSNTNPSVSSNFSFDSTSTCPELTSMSAPVVLAVGATCTDVIHFTPQLAGNNTGMLITTDNSANVAGSTQVINLTAVATQGTPTVTVANVTGTLGQNATLTATITGGGAVPAGGVSFVVTSGNSVAGSSVTATNCTSSKTAETCTVSYPTGTILTAGANTITATVAADANYVSATGTGTLTLNPAPTTSAVASSLNSSNWGQNVTFTATVTSSYGTPTGTVTFLDNGVSIGTGTLSAVNGTTATTTFATTNLAVGTHPITVSYGGATSFATSTSTATLNQVVKQDPQTSTDSLNGSGTYGAPTSSVTVNIPYAGLAPSTGVITLTDAQGETQTIQPSSCTTAGGVLTCVATMPTAKEPFGNNTITITQAGDTNYAGSTGSGQINITKALATTTDTGSGTGSYGASTTPVTVKIPYAGTASPTGAVTLTDGQGETITIQSSACSAAAGVLTCPNIAMPTAKEPVGNSNSVTVSQAADGNYSGSTGTATVTINPAASTNTDTGSGSGTYGSTSTAVTVKIPFAGTAAPTGLVTVTDSLNETGTLPGTSCTAAGNVLTCTVTVNTSKEPVGTTNAITISQAGDGNYVGSTGTGTIAITAAPATTTDTASGTGTYGATTTPVTVNIPYAGTVAPSGKVTVTDSLGETVSVTASSCTAANNVLSCTVSLPTAKEPVGNNNTVTVSQAADSNYLGSTGTGSVAIGAAPASSNDTASGTGTYGATTTAVTVKIPYGGTVAPSGNVTVTDSLGETATVTNSACSAASNVLTCTVPLPTAKEPVGNNNTVSISQAADSNYAASTGAGAVTIGPAPASNNDTAAGTGTYGAATTAVTVKIPYAGTAAPTGNVTVTDSLGETNTVQASSCTAANNVLTCTVSLATVKEGLGNNNLTVGQASDGNYAASTGTGSITIGQAPASSNDTASGTGNYGAATTTVTVKIPYAGTAFPSGNVTVTDGLGETNTVPASACTAAGGVLSCPVALPTSKESLGSNPVTVGQLADSNYAASSGTGAVTINPAATTNTDTASGSGTYGATSTNVTVKIPYAGAVAPSGNVTVTDALGETNTVPASGCTAAGNVLTCTVALPTAKEPVSNNNVVSISQAADGNYAGSTGTGSISITAAAATSNDTLSGTGTYGAATTNVTVKIPYAGATAPTGAITLSDGLGESLTVAASTCTNASGALTCTIALPTAKEPVGNNTANVSQAGDGNYAGSTGTGTIKINPIAATNTDTATGTGTYGAATTNVTVKIPYSGPTAPTGQVTVTDGLGETNNVAASTCTAASGVLSCTVPLPTAKEPVGTNNTVSISQAADSNYAGSTGTGSVTINPAPASTADTASGTGTYGAATTSVTVKIPYAGAVAPTGNVTLTDTYGETLTVPATACTAAGGVLSCSMALPTVKEPVGNNNAVTVSQLADGNYAASTGTGSITINQAAGSTADTASGSGTYGAATTAVTVKIPYSGPTAPTGQVTVTDSLGETANVAASTCTSASGTLTCTVNLPTVNEPVGNNNTVTVSQAADANYAASSGAGSVAIAKGLAGTADTANGSGTFGVSPTAITVKIPYTGTTAPTGLVTVSDGYNETATAPASSCTAGGGALTCSLSLATLGEPAGSNALSVSQAADNNYNASSGTGSVTLAKAGGSAKDAASGNGTVGTATTPITVTIPYAGPSAPTGQITVTDSFNESVMIQASACTAANNQLTCSANLQTSSEPVGNNSVTVSQLADNNYTASTGTGTIVIAKIAASSNDTASGAGVYGAANTPVAVKIPYPGTTAPTGAITLSDGYGESITFAASTCTASGGALNCTANLATINEPVGSNNVTVSQASDANYSGSTGGGTVTIAKVPGGNSDTANGSGTYGMGTTAVTVKIPYSGPVAPTGAVTVTDSVNETQTVAASTCSAAGGALTCTVNLTTTNEAVGSNAVTVSQAADNNYNTSTGSGTVVLAKAAATSNDSANGTGTFGAANSPVVVKIPYAGSAAPTGLITVADGVGESVQVAASTCTASGGVLSCTVTMPSAKEPVGNNSLTVTQVADTNYNQSTGTGTLAIGKIAATNTDTVTGSGTYGSATTPVTVTIPYSGGTAPSGLITVTDAIGNTVNIPAASCTAVNSVLTCFGNLPTANEPVGSNALTVSQAADSNYSGSTGTGTLTTAKAPATTTDTANGAGVYGAASSPVKVILPYAGVTAPTGAITVTDTFNNTVTVQASICTASNGALTCLVSLATATEPVGANSVTVSQAADSNYSGSTGIGTVTISKATSTTNDSVTGTGVYGAATTPIKVQIPYAGETAPAGLITVADTHGNTVTIPAASCTASGGILSCTGALPTPNEPVGSNNATVTQAADPNYGGSSGVGVISIAKSPLTTTDTAIGTGTYGSATTPVAVSIPFTGATAPTGAVTVTDTHGNTVTVAGSSCSAAAGTLSCTVNLTTANEPVGANAVTVTQADDADYSGSTGTGTVTIGKAPATTTDSATGYGTYGAATTAVTVTIPYAGTTAPTGPITVSDGYNNTITVPASGCTASGGALTCTANLPTMNEPVGSNPLTVSQAADGNYSGSTGTGSVTVNPAGARNDDSVTGTGSYGAANTAITVVIPYSGTTAPTGTIVVADSLGNTVQISPASCSASGGALICAANLPTASEGVGPNPVTVAEAADPSHSSSTGAGSVLINRAAATTTDTATGTGTYGAATTPVTVTIPYIGAAAPTGTVTVTDSLGNTASVVGSACNAASQTLTCSVNLPTANDPEGTTQLTVDQAGDTNYSGSTGTGTVTIAMATVSPVASTSGGVQNVTISQGTPATLLTSILAYNGAVGPTGAVTFTVAGGPAVTATCTAGASPEVCTAVYQTGSLAVGTYIITSNEAADADYTAGSSTATLTVAAGPVSPILDTVSNVGNVLTAAGTQSATFTANIVYTGPLPTGGLTFSVPGGPVVNATCTSGPSPLTCTAPYPTASLAVGTYVITATEAADNNYPQGSATALLTVEPNASTPASPILETGSAVNSALVSYGTPSATLSATIVYTGPAPTGAVTFTVIGGPGTVVPASCTTGASPLSCTAVYPTATLGIGSYRIQLNEAADANYPAGSAIGTLTVTNIASSSSDAVTGTGTYGAATTPVTVTIAYNIATPPSGAITVTDSQNNTVTVPASACTAANGELSCPANLPTANVAAGTETAAVSQAGDQYYAASSGSGTITINKAPATSTDIVTGTGTFGGATTPVTVTIPYTGSVAPSGAITVSDSLGDTVTIPASSCTSAGGALTCTANLPTANNPAGSVQLTVSQAGDSNYAGSTGGGTLTIGKAASGNDSATGTGTYGTATTAVTVTIPFTGSVASTGLVTVTDSLGETVSTPATSCTSAGGVLTCLANLPTAKEPAGANTVTVSQVADPNHSASTGPGTVTIQKAPLTTTDAAVGTGIFGAATSPVTVTIPYTGSAAPSGAIRITDGFNETVSVPASGCTAANGVLSCTANLPTAGEPLGANPLTVSQAADANYLGSTGTGTMTINKAGAGNGDTATGTGTYGSATTPVTITIPFTDGSAPTGAVTLTDTHNNTVTVPAQSCTATKTTLTCTANLPTGNEPVGGNAVTVSQAPGAVDNGSTGTGTVTINKAPATSSDSVTGSGTYGAATTQVTVTIPYTGAAAPTGAITVTDSLGNTVTVQAASCTAAAGALTCKATLPTANEPTGSNTLTVAQAADANYSGSTGTGAATISKGSANGDTASGTGTYGATTTPLTVTIPYTGATAPTGAITVTDALGNTVTVQAASCTAAAFALTCKATLPTANEPTGSNALTVSQAADANYAASTGTGSVTMNKAPATTGDNVTGSGTYGAATTPVTVTIPYTGATAPTGAVTVTDSLGNTVTVQAASCTAAGGALTCKANLPTANEPTGSNALTVAQAGDANYSGSTGTGSVSLSKSGATLPAPVVSPLNAAEGTSVTITETVPAGETGTVTFLNNGTALGTAKIVNGVATFTTTALPAGTDSITASASGDSNFGAATSPAVTDNVAAMNTKVSLASSQSTSNPGVSVTFTATVAAGSTAANAITGTVTFFDGTTAIGTGTVGNGVATLSTSTLAPGTHPITATFTPASGSTLTQATSAVLTQTVIAAAASVNLASSLNPAIVEQAVTFTAVVPTTLGGTVPTGTVTFYDGTTVLGTAQLNGSGVATLTSSKMTGGMHTVTAVYGGDTDYATATSAAVAQGISDYTVGNTTPTVGVNPGSTAAFNITIKPVTGVAFGSPVVLTVTGLPANFTASFGTGTVTPGTAGASSSMSVVTYAQLTAALQRQQQTKKLEAAALWAFLLPLLGMRRVRRRLPKVLLMLAVGVASFGVIAPLTGCGGGYFGPGPASYTLTVTGTSGSLTRSTTVTLNVQ